MNSYRIETIGKIYGKTINFKNAYTPFDAAEMSMIRMPWRHKEDVTHQIVMILDGSKKTWRFEK